MTIQLRFTLLFALNFALLTSAFEAARGTAFEQLVVERSLLTPAADLIDIVTPAEHVEVIGHTLRSPASRLNVTRGCEGFELLLMLLAAIIAFPASLRARLRGLLVGGSIAYLLSIARLTVLHYTLRYSPGLWEALHGLVLSIVPVMILAAYFLRWTDEAGSNGIDLRLAIRGGLCGRNFSGF